MCGILGWWSPAPVDLACFDAALERMRHRGPDDSGLWRCPSGRAAAPSREGGAPGLPAGAELVFGHRRLSIIDLATGHQPMSADGVRSSTPLRFGVNCSYLSNEKTIV